MIRIYSYLLTVQLCLGGNPITAEEPAVDFQREIQPILQARCYECHAEKKNGGLRLTSRREAFTPADSGEVVITPGKPKESELLRRILSTEEFEQMPPEGERLTAKQIALIERWIAEGAQWPESEEKTIHWAYVKPVRPALPPVKQSTWGTNEIDRLILAKLEQHQLSPSEPEEKAKLLRRVHLTLTGLPPTVEQVDAFLADTSPQAYEKVVDQLLNSPHFGERWARPWLDLARYADSNGFQADQLRESWPYRDWVINALNQDMPFDQFVIEQLAGDLLPNATLEQKIATGFHRTVTCNVEAGVHPEENRTNQVIDRVNTTATVFLGTTLECCQCHNHKYDPFTQLDYYRLFAAFNNTPLEVELESGVQYNFSGPKMELPLSEEQQAQREQLLARKQQLEQQRAEIVARDRANWEQEVLAVTENVARWAPLPISHFESTGGEDHTLNEDHSLLVTGRVPNITTYTLTLETNLTNINGFKLEALTDPSLPGQGPGRGDPQRPNFVLHEFQVEQVDGEKTQPIPLHSAQADFSQVRWDVPGAIDGDLKTGWAINPEFGKPHWATFLTKSPLGSEQGLTLRIVLIQNFGQGRTIGKLRISALIGDPAAQAVPAEIVALIEKSNRNAKEEQRLSEYFEKSYAELKSLNADIQQVEKSLAEIKPASTLIMVEMEQPRETNILIRGDYLNPGKPVSFGTPATLHPFDSALPANRLGLAKWLVHEDNPLLARVTVNRLWGEVFGQGIVATQEDFGTQADPPTHPELLDWLAVEFRDNGWSMKQILRQMVLSSTFRQSSRITPELLEADPENKLYSRGPRFRMSAEMIRDNALAVSGLLSRKFGGPPVMPYQPDNLWRAVGRNAPVWKTALDEDRFRRGIYVIWRRAAPYPSFTNFDAPDRASCVVKRPRTNTPLQALTLLNDPAYLEMAAALAWKLHSLEGNSSAEEQAIHGFRTCVSRAPSERELATLMQLYRQELERLRANPQLAEQLFQGIKGFQPPEKADLVELAAWFHVANVLLNLDEIITVG